MKTKFEKWLQNVGLKKTKHRLLILDILDSEHNFLSAEDIFIKAKEEDASISLSTVYRILESLTKQQLVDTVNVEYSKQVLYEIKHDAHAHHLICLGCHKVIHIENCPVHEYEKNVEKTYDFKVSSHTLDLYGYCKDCQKKL